ncbi:MAG TPA: NUDIX domain-containing protein, partial [Candidatus Woesebacteria bacterium]|nr:NUDIX domain-containing protein [Candidatus Woesebacteria bacterium]
MPQSTNNNRPYDERSAGGLVYKREGNKIYWLVIKTAGREKTKTFYKLSKGHTRNQEYLKQTALREVEEEGQIKAKIVAKLGSNNYFIWDRQQRKRIVKKVTFFLMEYTGESRLRHYDAEMVIDH